MVLLGGWNRKVEILANENLCWQAMMTLGGVTFQMHDTFHEFGGRLSYWFWSSICYLTYLLKPLFVRNISRDE